MADKRRYIDRAEELKFSVKKRRKALKILAVDYLGGKCCICGYNKCKAALEFHHVNPKEKSFSLSVEGITRSWDKTRTELDKCILVCANCHREIEAGLINFASSITAMQSAVNRTIDSSNLSLRASRN